MKAGVKMAKQLGVRLDDDLRKKVKICAAMLDISMNKFIEQVLIEKIEKILNEK